MKNYSSCISFALAISTFALLPTALFGVDVNGDGIEDTIVTVYPEWIPWDPPDGDYFVSLYNTDSSREYMIQSSSNQVNWLDETFWMPGTGGLLLCIWASPLVSYHRCVTKEKVNIDVGAIARIPIYGSPHTIQGSVNIQITGDDLSSGQTVDLTLETVSGTGLAKFNNGSTTKSVTATVYLRGHTNSNQKDNIRLKAKIDSTVYDTELLSVRTYPINFKQTSYSVLSGYIMKFTYTWESESGKLTDIDDVWTGEHVAYDNGGINPQPPWKGTFDDPTVVPPNFLNNAFFGFSTDIHIPPGGQLPDQIPFDFFVGTQYYVFIDLIFNPSPPPNLSNMTNMPGSVQMPIQIHRFVEFSQGQYRYRITKSGKTLIKQLF